MSSGAVTLGVIQAFGLVNYNEIWFGFLTFLATLLTTLLLGGDASNLAMNLL
jgi:hypothetical protein